MAINYELINKGGISLSANFELLSAKPLDARLVIPTLSGLQHLIDSAAAYAGMVVYVTEKAKHYQVNADGTYREFGITVDELKELIATETTAAMEFKGATNAIPASANKGDMYKVSASFTVAAANDAQGTGFTTKVGDSIVYDGAKWYIVPTGDDIEDTWRPVTNVANDATLTFAAGDKLDVAVASNGTVTYSHEAIETTNEGTETETRTYVSSITTDGHGHITGYKTATENVEDTNTTYDFECQVSDTDHSGVYFNVKASDSEIAQTVCLDAYTRNDTDNKLTTKLDAGDWTNVNNVIALAEEETNSDARLSLSELTIYNGRNYSSVVVKPGAIELLDAGDTYTHYNIGGIYYAREVPDPNETFEAYLSLPQESGTLALQADVDAKLDAGNWTINDSTLSTGDAVNSIKLDNTGITIEFDDDATETFVGGSGLYTHDYGRELDTTYAPGCIINKDKEIYIPEASGTIALTSDLTDYHKDYQSGTIVDTNHNNVTDPSFITGITIQNGHVTDDTVQNLKEVLQNIIVVLDGGTLKIG